MSKEGRRRWSVVVDGRDVSHDGWTSALHGDCDRLRELLDHGNFELDQLHPVSGQTALHLACMQGQEDVVGMLLRKGADVDVKDKVLQETALHKAVCGGHARIVQMLLALNPNKAARNRYGLSPIDMARKRKNKMVCKVLGESMADQALERGKHLVYEELSRLAQEEKEEKEEEAKRNELVDREVELLKHVRQLEKQMNVMKHSLNRERKKSVIHQESFEDAVGVISSREIQLEQLEARLEDLEAMLEIERERNDALTKQLESTRLSASDKVKLQRLEQSAKLQASQEAEKQAMVKREKEIFESRDKANQAHIQRLQKRIAELETEHETKVAELLQRCAKEEERAFELKLQLSRFASAGIESLQNSSRLTA